MKVLKFKVNWLYRLAWVVLLVLLSASALADQSPKSNGFTVAMGKSQANTTVLRFGISRSMTRRWFFQGDWLMTGYWLAELGYWRSRADKSSTGEDELAELALTPIFRWHRSAWAGSGFAPYFQGGVGLRLIGPTSLAGRNFSTALQFSSQFGLGVSFGPGGRYQLGYIFEHMSNGSIKSPNNGMNMHLIRFDLTH